MLLTPSERIGYIYEVNTGFYLKIQEYKITFGYQNCDVWNKIIGLKGNGKNYFRKST